MRRVVPLFLACALATACVAPEDEATVGRSSLRVITLGEGVHIVEASVAPGQIESVSFQTASDTLVAVVENQEVVGDGAVLSSLDQLPTPDNADCVGVGSGASCLFPMPAAAAVNVGVAAGSAGSGMTVKLRVVIQPGNSIGGGDDCDDSFNDPDCGISTSP